MEALDEQVATGRGPANGRFPRGARKKRSKKCPKETNEPKVIDGDRRRAPREPTPTPIIQRIIRPEAAADDAISFDSPSIVDAGLNDSWPASNLGAAGSFFLLRSPQKCNVVSIFFSCIGIDFHRLDLVLWRRVVRLCFWDICPCFLFF